MVVPPIPLYDRRRDRFIREGHVMIALFRFVALALALTPALATAQTPSDAARYPERTIRIIVPFPAGGPTDILARVIGQRLAEDWGQPVVIENRPGGDTVIAAQQVAKATPDGYTLLAAMDTTLVMNPATKKNLPYDPHKDFAFITMASQNTSLLSVRADDGPRTVQELIAKAKANPGKLNYGAGIITTRLAGYLFAREAGIQVQLIPYKGSSDVVQGLLTGAVDFIVDGIATALPLVKGGKVRALAKLNSRPLPALPEVQPLAVAAGLPGFADISSWTGLVAPAGTPRQIVDKIQREVAKMYADPAIFKKLEGSGITAVSSTPEEFEAYFRKEAARWDTAFRESGIRLD
jgi:tripartite-type tricarboxylate transporter receptor subunit TctC